MPAEQPRREYRPQTLRAMPDDAGEIEAPPPVNADAERSVIGAILLRPELIREIDGTLDATDFYYDRHRIMFAALRAMADRGDGIDPLTLEAELSRAGLLDAIGGPLAIIEARDTTPAAANVSYYAAIVTRDAVRRRVIAVCRETAELAADDGVDELDLIDAVEGLAFEALAKIAPTGRGPEHGIRSIAAHLADARTERAVVPTGIRAIDDLSDEGGYPPGFLVMLAARTTMGKTALASTIVGNVSGNKTPALYIALEPPGRVVWNTALSLNINARIRDAIEASGADAWARGFDGLPLMVLERKGQPTSLAQIRGAIRRDVVNRGTKFVAVDQLSTITRTDAERKRHWTERDWYSHCGDTLSNLADECGIVLLLIHQINRDGGKLRRPSMLNLSGCGRLEELADSVILWDRDEGRGNLETEQALLRDDQGWLSVPKRREGRTLREAVLAWHGPTGVVADDHTGLPGYRAPRADRRAGPD